jgi:integrase
MVTDVGLEQRTKSDAGWRVISVPPSTVAMLGRRLADPAINTTDVVFASPLGRLRDTSNTAADLRRVFDRAGFGWVSSHTLRKTVATRLDDAGFSARQIADHLGHAQPSMTQDVYLGRRAADPAVASILELA